MKFLRPLLLALLATISIQIQAQSLEKVEQQLAKMSYEVLNHDSLDYKIRLNKEFASLLIATLERPESFDYPFDSLKTMSVLRASDNSFRIFTWYIVDKNYNQYYGEQYHYYFGLIQRRMKTQGKTETLVIPLIETKGVPEGVENMLLDNSKWLGALYYEPRYHDGIPVHEIDYFKLDPQTGKRVKARQKLYVLLGWNGYDMSRNYKVVEVMSFDPDNPERVIFGSDLFYFDIIPKFRALFFYSDYAPFTLNYAYVKKGLFGKKKMIVYDHLAVPRQHRNQLDNISELGPDGSYDALYFYKRGGYFEWYRNVQLAEKYNNKITQKELQRQREEEQKKLREAGIEPPKGSSNDKN